MISSIYWTNDSSLSATTFQHNSIKDSVKDSILFYLNKYTKSKNNLVPVVLPIFRTYSSSELINRMFDYEKKYGLKSDKFFSMFKNNSLKENDDFIDWAILYKKFFLKSKIDE